MDVAKVVASKSKDKSMKVGTVIVSANNSILASGYNGFPRGVDEEVLPARSERPEKYFWTEHAERNAVYNAALNGVKLCYSIAYSTAHPCVECARAFIQSGVSDLYLPIKENDALTLAGRWEAWEDQIDKSLEILDASGVIIHYVR